MPLPPNPAQKLYAAPYADLVALLLKQFKRLLTQHDITLTSETIEAISQAAADDASLPEPAPAIRTALVALVTESLTLLQTRFGFDYATSLRTTDMDEIGGWQTTAEFLEIADQKSNAELRISSGSTLLLMLGDPRFVGPLLAVLENDGGADDIDAVLAKRAFAHAAGISPRAADFVEQARQWAANAGSV